MQLEFMMLDPHVRTALAPVPGSPGTYSVQFRVPDRHGVFKFVVDYRRKGCVLSYSFLSFAFFPPPFLLLFIIIALTMRADGILLVARFYYLQVDPPVQCDYRPCCTTKARRVPTIPERSLAVLYRCDQLEYRVCALLRDVARRRG